MTRVGLIGLGRTGSIVARELLNHPDFQLVMSMVSPGSARIGLDIGEHLNIGSRGLSIKGGNLLEGELIAANPQVIRAYGPRYRATRRQGVWIRSWNSITMQ